jgi:hypothetical protein
MKATTHLVSAVVLLCALGSMRLEARSIHLWTFDEDGGEHAADALGTRAGTVHGAQRTPGQIGSGLRFDGVDDYVALPDNNPVWLPTGDFTISFWVYFERDKGSVVEDSEVLVDFNHGSSSDPAYELGYNVQRRGDTGKIAFQSTSLRDSDEDLYSNLVPVKNRWYHVVAVRQGTLQRICIDGQLDAWRVCSSTPVDFVGGYDDDKVNVGRFTSSVGAPRYHFKGILDELMLFDWALSLTEIRQLYRDGTTAHTLFVDATRGSNSRDGRRPFTAFATIQKAIDVAQHGDTVNILPGVYRKPINFLGKSITVQSRGDAAILATPDRTAVTFYMGEGHNAVLRNLIIADSYVGIFCAHTSPTITNVTLVGNVFGLEAYGRNLPQVSNCIFWGNTDSDVYGCPVTYCCVERGADGEGNFGADPLFVDPEDGDYHLRSEHGRYWPAHDVWVLDDLTSPCIDAGDPAADFSPEREPNGGRLNVGAHGGTAYASVSTPPFSADVNHDGAVDAADLELFTDLWEQQTQPPAPPNPGRR